MQCIDGYMGVCVIVCVCVCLCVAVHGIAYLNSNGAQDELGLRLGEAGLDLWGHADEGTVGHHGDHTHDLEGELRQGET